MIIFSTTSSFKPVHAATNITIGQGFYDIQPVTLNYSNLDGSPITPLPPHIQPPYSAAIIAAEAIGSTGSVQVVEISINATNISGYAIFQYGRLFRAVFINNAAHLPGGGSRNVTRIDIHFSGSGLPALAMEVKRRMQTRPLGSHGEDKRMKSRTLGLVDRFRYIEFLDVAQGLDIQDTEAVLLSFL